MPGPVSPPPRAVTARHVLPVLAAGMAIRLALLRLPRLWFDEATVGLLGLSVLRGELPIYFYGQPFMGALDGYLAAPLYFALGVSARTLKLVPVLLALVWVGLVVRLAWEAFGPRAALFTALVLAIPPDFLLYWSHQARPHYPLAMVLGTLALMLALRVPGRSRARTALHFGVLGLVLGLAVWTNFLAVVYFPAVAVLVLRQGIGTSLNLGVLSGLFAFGLGSLPHWLYGLQHDTTLPPPGDPITLGELITHLRTFGRVSWPVLAGVPAELRGVAPGAFLALGLAGIYAGALALAARALRRSSPGARRLGLALFVLVATNIGAAAGTRYGEGLNDRDQRYLLPLYTALPALLGQGLAACGPWCGGALAGALVLAQGADALTGSFRSLAPAVAELERVELRRQLDTLVTLERQGPRRLYAADPDMRIITFLSRERVIFSSHYEEILPAHALAVDGAEEIGWWTPGPSPVLETNLAALGARFAFRPLGPLGGAYVDFALKPEPLRELDPAGLSVGASENAEAAGFTVDRDAATVWGTGRPQHGGEWIQVDLGKVEPVALVRWIPGSFQEVPKGVTLESSVDGRTWRPLIVLPEYLGPLYWSAGHPMARVRGGRVELRVPPTPARYLRVTQTGRDGFRPWTVRELFVYAATGAPPPAPGADGPTLARALRAAGVTRLYADHGWGSRVVVADRTIRVLPANLFLDAYGFTGSGRDLLAPVHWGPGEGALLEPADAEGFARVARAGGLGFTRQPLGGLVLFAYTKGPLPSGIPLAAAELAVTASPHPEAAGQAIDGDPRTRWATARPRRAGDWFQIDLATPRSVRGVRVWTSHPADMPRAIALEGSEDGVTWHPLTTEVQTEGPHRWGGIALLRDGVEGVRLDFAPVRTRALRLSLTHGDPVFDWSIHELTVFGAD